MLNLENEPFEIVDNGNKIYAEVLDENCIILEIMCTDDSGMIFNCGIHLDCGQIEVLKAWLNEITKQS